MNTSPRRRVWLRLLIGIGIGAVVVVAIASVYAGRIAKKHLVESLEQHYHAKVELKDFKVLVFPRIVIIGNELAMHQRRGAEGLPPFIQIQKFTTDASIIDLLRKKKRIRLVTLNGLQINVARRGDNKDEANDQDQGKGKKNIPDFVIDEVEADGTKLTVFPKDQKKDPMVWDIQKLHLKSAGNYTSMNYKATLKNATPPGMINSQGYFGPLNVDDIGQTPLGGEYKFRDADLGVFHGISGKLASDGRFEGKLEKMAVDGKTDIPDFQVGGKPVELKTEFHAIVDGTNGDTTLDPVHVMFLNSEMMAKGKVEGSEGQQGKTISLTVDTQKARVEDILALVVKGEPPLKGNATFHTSFELPPGKQDVMEKLKLKGTFGLEQTKFTKNGLQQKVAKLSAKAQGKDEPVPAGDTASNFHGNFTLGNGQARFSKLQFDVPGAKVDLTGDFNLKSEELDFQGHLYMDATLSQMTSGVKGFFAKIVQPLVTKNNDTVIPIKITGTRKEPKFGVQLGKLLKRQ